MSRPLHGRWADRAPLARVLLVPSAVNGVAMAGLAVATWQDAGALVLLLLAALAGLSLPAVSAVLRSLWPRLSGIPAKRAYAFDTMLYELSLVISAPLVGLLAVALSPSVALLVLAVAGTVGTIAVVRTSSALPAAIHHRSGRSHGLLRGALGVLLAVSLLVGLAEGSLTVIVPAFASRCRS